MTKFQTNMTVGELRALVQSNAGRLEIGKLVFVIENDEADIDISFDHELIQWFPKDRDTALSVSDASAYSIMDSFTKRRELLKEAQDEAKQLAEENTKLKKEATDASLALGKVAAYENLLIGRAITVSA